MFPSTSLPPACLVFLYVLGLRQHFVRSLRGLLANSHLVLVRVLNGLVRLSSVVYGSLHDLFVLPSCGLRGLLIRGYLHLGKAN